MIIIDAKATGYAPGQCRRTMTVGEMIGLLEDFDENTPMYLSFDNGFTYGAITEDSIEEMESE